MLNATVVESGRQVAIAPVELEPAEKDATPDLQSLQTALGLPQEDDVPLSTAMSLSARFPVIMPAGLVRTKAREFRVVDGGYFENSGVESASAIIEQLKQAVCASPQSPADECPAEGFAFPVESKTILRFKMLVLTDFDPSPDYHGQDAKRDEGLNEILSPVRAMSHARVARGHLAVGRIGRKRYGTFPTPPISLSHRIYKLPLGWQLSSQVQDVISAQITTDCNWKDFDKFINAFPALSWIDGGLEIVDAAKSNRKPKPYLDTPWRQILTTLKNSHCAAFQVLSDDKVTEPPPELR